MATSPQKIILDAVQTGIRSLNLTDIVSANVSDPTWIPRALSDVELASLPKILICPWDRLNFPGIMNNEDDIGVPVVVVFIAAQNQNNTANMDRNMLWVWRVLSHFRYQTLAGVPVDLCVYNCVPMPDVQVNMEFFRAGLFVHALGLNFITRTQRGAYP